MAVVVVVVAAAAAAAAAVIYGVPGVVLIRSGDGGGCGCGSGVVLFRRLVRYPPSSHTVDAPPGGGRLVGMRQVLALQPLAPAVVTLPVADPQLWTPSSPCVAHLGRRKEDADFVHVPASCCFNLLINLMHMLRRYLYDLTVWLKDAQGRVSR